MTEIEYNFITGKDEESIRLIADWYLSEWKIPVETSAEKIKNLMKENNEFQVLMKLNGQAVGTAGLYTHVGLIDREPRFRIFRNWLALVYTKPEYRRQGLGAILCTYIQEYAKNLGLKEIFLFTHTAESLYRRLGWEAIERLSLGERNITVMKLSLGQMLSN